MPRSQSHQPITQVVNDLVIGKPQIRFREIDGVVFVDATADATASPLSSTYSIGAIQSGSLVAAAEFKQHFSRFPSVEDARILEKSTVTHTCVVEEIASTPIKAILQSIIDQIAGEAPKRYATEMRVSKVAGGGISFYSNNTQLKPQFSISTQNDWHGVELQFEALLNSTYTNTDLLYRSTFTGSSRLVADQATTKDKNALTIGFAQVRVGPPIPRATEFLGSGVDGSIYPPRFFPAAATSNTVAADMTVNDGADVYTGSRDGAYIVEITDSKWQRLSTNAGTTFNTVGNTTFTFEADAVEVAVTFTSDAALPIATVVSEINTVSIGTGLGVAVASATADNRILIEAPAGIVTGAVEITGANTILGFAVAAIPTAAKFSYYNLEGTRSAPATITGGSQALAEAVAITFTTILNNAASEQYSVFDRWVIPLTANTAVTAANAGTEVWSPYPYLRPANTVGAVQAATITVEADLKPHESGYPQKKDYEIAEAVRVFLDVSIEEFTMSSGTMVAGAATTIADMVVDASANSIVNYYVPAEFMIESLDGQVVTFWLPNAQIAGQIDLNTADEWGALPFQLVSQIQDESIFTSGTAPRHLYMYDSDNHGIT